MARFSDPARYNCQPLIAQLAVRHAAHEQHPQPDSGTVSVLLLSVHLEEPNLSVKLSAEVRVA